MSIAEILDNLDYGPAPESDKEARAWLKTRQAGTELFIDGGWRKPKIGDLVRYDRSGDGRGARPRRPGGRSRCRCGGRGRRQGAEEMGGAPRPCPRDLSLRDRAADPEEQPALCRARDPRQRQVDPRDARHRHPAGRPPFLSSCRLGRDHGERISRPDSGRGLRPDHPVELSAPHARLEDRAGDRPRQHVSSSSRRSSRRSPRFSSPRSAGWRVCRRAWSTSSPATGRPAN